MEVLKLENRSLFGHLHHAPDTSIFIAPTSSFLSTVNRGNPDQRGIFAQSVCLSVQSQIMRRQTLLYKKC